MYKVIRMLKKLLTKIYLKLIGSYIPDYSNGEGDRPHYGYCITKAAKLAINLGHKKVSIIELGVAGGRGLISIEKNCEIIKKTLDIDFEIYGFDMESGLPKPLDYRDEPYKWSEGFYKMDRKKLESRLKFSKLIIGDVSKTINSFFSDNNPAPIGCIMFDLDLYSSTKNAFKLFDGDDKFLLPRLMCYFDDIGCIEFLGERLAIREFNDENNNRKIGQNLKLKFNSKVRGNYIFEYHNFNHPDYAKKSELKTKTELELDS